MGYCVSIPLKSVKIGYLNKNANVIIDGYTYGPRYRQDRHKKSLNEDLNKFDALVECNLPEKRTLDFSEKRNAVFDSMIKINLYNDKGSKKVILEYKNTTKNIFLCNSHLFEIDENIGLFTSITGLELCCNYIATIPRTIKNLVNLKVLILGKNRITELPEEIGELVNLKELDLSYNKLRSLPKSLAGLSNLSTLSLNNNVFAKLPEVIGSMTHLKTLNVSNNLLKYIPLSVFKLPFLTTLTSHNNLFEQADTRIFNEGEKITLKEMLGREIVGKCLNIDKSMTILPKKHIISVEECGFCKGPLFDNYIEISGTQVFDGKNIPTKYKMCCKHYIEHNERLGAMFNYTPDENKMGYKKYNIKTVANIFQINTFNNTQIEFINKAQNSKGRRIPLMCLAVWNSSYYDKVKSKSNKTFTSFNELLEQISHYYK